MHTVVAFAAGVALQYAGLLGAPLPTAPAALRCPVAADVPRCAACAQASPTPPLAPSLTPSLASITALLQGDALDFTPIELPSRVPLAVRRLFLAPPHAPSSALSPYTGFDASLWPLNIAAFGTHVPLVTSLVAEVKPAVAVEFGSWYGHSALKIARAMLAAGAPQPVLYCVDTWQGAVQSMMPSRAAPERLPLFGAPSFYLQFLANVVHNNLTSVIVPIVQTSTSGARFLHAAGVRPQFVYLDGSHEYSDVLADLIYVWPLLDTAANSVLVGDDAQWDTVLDAVRAFLRTHCTSAGDRTEPRLSDSRTQWYLRRSDCALGPAPQPVQNWVHEAE